MVNAIDLSLSLAIPALVLLYLYAAPYTKVEESFNIQAIHDILRYGIPDPRSVEGSAEYIYKHYDHVSFPGSVPRTFVGAAVLSGLTRPFLGFLTSPTQLQLAVRAVLGLINAAALVRFRHAVDIAFGRTAGRFYLAFVATQFHVIYYASRTLPNMLAFPLTTEASRALLLALSASPKLKASSRRRRLTIYLLAVAGIILRAEAALLLTTVAASLFIFSSLSISRDLFLPLLAAGMIALPLTLGIDGFFWCSLVVPVTIGGHKVYQPVWPELQGFLFNIAQGHSAEWGTSPWHSYFTSALPKILLNPAIYLLGVPIALIVPATRRLSATILAATMSFVAAYSLVAHKEWRFIIYITPLLTAVGAAGASWAWTRRSKSFLYQSISRVILEILFLSLLASVAILWISSLNYPGGISLARLHALTDPTAVLQGGDVDSAEVAAWAATRQQKTGRITVFLDNLTLQTGVTRFQELHREGLVTWMYDKSEDKEAYLRPSFWNQFDFTIAEDPAKVIGSWKIIDTIYAVSGVGLKLDPENASKPGATTDQELEAGVVHVEHDVAKERAVLVPSIPGTLGGRVEELVGRIAHTVAAKYTRGYWPHLKTRPRLYVLQNERRSLQPENEPDTAQEARNGEHDRQTTA